MFNRLKQIKGGDGTGRPIISNSEIRFNGDASKGEDHETFVLEKNGSGFQFCKTARKPYDRYVKAVLLVAKAVAPAAVEISSDGDGEAGCWDEGQRIANLYLNDKSPVTVTPVKTPAERDTIIPNDDTVDNAISKIHKLAELMDDKTIKFLANYLTANSEDVKDAYQAT